MNTRVIKTQGFSGAKAMFPSLILHICSPQKALTLGTQKNISPPCVSEWSNLSGLATGMWPGLRWAMYRPAQRRAKWLFMLLFPDCEARNHGLQVVAPLVNSCSGDASLLQELVSNSGSPDLKNENTGHTQVNLNFRWTTNPLVQVSSMQYLGIYPEKVFVANLELKLNCIISGTISWFIR